MAKLTLITCVKSRFLILNSYSRMNVCLVVTWVEASFFLGCSSVDSSSEELVRTMTSCSSALAASLARISRYAVAHVEAGYPPLTLATPRSLRWPATRCLTFLSSLIFVMSCLSDAWPDAGGCLSDCSMDRNMVRRRRSDSEASLG